MLNTLKDQIAKDIVLSLQQKQRIQDFYASGKASKAWVYTVSATKIQIFGENYIFQNWKGRLPGTYPPIRAIRQWLADKGLRLNAWAVREKLKQKGDQVHRGDRKGLELENAVTETLQRNKAEYERILLFNIEQQLRQAWQSA